jgi:phosphoenolpyruvate-protein kinase (PTS system EI component)
VATVEELRAALTVLAAARHELGTRAGEPEIGIMIEVPAAALAADALAREVDFFSVGTNDLAQYTLAADRGNERVAALADALHPAVLRLIGAAADAAAAHGRWIGVCGELASDPLAAAPLIGLGVTELSVAPPAVPATKEAVRAVDSADAAALARELLAAESAGAVRARLAESVAA